MVKKRSIKLEEEVKLIEEIEKKKKAIVKQKLKKEIKHFHFKDFSQIVIGVSVFGLPALINTSFWDYLPRVSLEFLLYVHIFFIFSAVIATNYQFRDNFDLKDKWFMTMFIKRVFYIYISVMITMTILVVLVNKVSFDMKMYDFLKNFLAAQSVGIVGAVTFTFFKKED